MRAELVRKIAITGAEMKLSEEVAIARMLVKDGSTDAAIYEHLMSLGAETDIQKVLDIVRDHRYNWFGCESNGIEVHKYESSREAYDNSQCNEAVKIGDILVVESEEIIGFMMGAWPTAIDYNPEHGPGAFHTMAPHYDPLTIDDGVYAESVEMIRSIDSKNLGENGRDLLNKAVANHA